jgi:hypothetical protein
MSKGSNRRPSQVDEQTESDNWARIFPKTERQTDQAWLENNRAEHIAQAQLEKQECPAQQ